MNSKILIFIFLLALYFKADSQISYTVNINASNVSISSIAAADGNIYSHVDIPKLYTLRDTGKPALPMKYIKLYIPNGKDVDNISFTTTSAITYNLSSEVFPMQKPIPTSTASIVQGFTNPDQTIYSSNSAWPSEMVKITGKGYFDSKNQIITIAVTPFQYYPSMNKLDFYSSINITINLKQSTNSSVASVKNRTPSNQEMYANILKSMVDNPQDIPALVIDTTTSSLMKTTLTMTLPPAYEYVIITDASLASYFADFVEWKKKKGIDIGIVTTQDIYSSYSSNTIDTYPILDGGNLDHAARIREYLKDAHNNGTVWALLGGDLTYVPIRYGWNIDDYDDTEYVIPADLYFSEFNGDWNVDNDTRYGEPNNDNPDYIADIFVGRLLCSTGNQITNWTNNVLKYEQNPGNGNYSYLLNAFSIQADQLQQGNQADSVAVRLPMFNHTIWGELPTPNAIYDTNGYVLPGGTVMGHHKGAEVISEMNNHYGLYSWFCHGGTGPDGSGGESGIVTMSNSVHGDPNWKIQAQDAHDYSGSISESYNGLDNLNNANYPSILYGISCWVTPFDLTSSMGLNGAMNSGEAYTTLANTGGAAFLGHTRDGWISESYLVYENFANRITSNDYHSHLGVSECISKSDYPDPYLVYSHNLIGCPETQMWTATPQNLNITMSSDLTPNTINTVTVTINNLPAGKQALICLYKVNDIFARQVVTGTGNSITAFFNTVQPTSTGYLDVTVTAHNYIPYQGTIPICTFNSTAWNINSNYTINSVTVVNSDINVNSPATLTINNKLYLKNHATFTVKNGASLIINANGSIWGGCNSSANSVWCGNLIFEGNADVTIYSW